MSFILNALRKSEHDRKASQSVSLEKSLQEKPQTQQKSSSRWIIILVFLNLLLIAYFIWSINNDDDDELQTSSNTDKQLIAPSPTESQLKPEVARPKINKPVIKPTRLSIADQVKVKQTKKATTAKKTQIKSNSKKIGKPIEKQNIIPKSVAKVVKKPKSKTLTQTNSKTTTGQEKNKELPFLSDMDYEFRRSVPTIDINVFVYSDNHEESFILANMTKYIAGEEFESGVMLKEIRKNSIVVEYNNKEFQIKRK